MAVLTDLDWLTELDGKIARICLRWPDAFPIFQTLRDDVRYVLSGQEVLDWQEMLRNIKGRATALMVNYQDFDEDLRPTLNKMSQL